jgi:uncharacterized membrane protein
MADQWPDSRSHRKALIGAGVAVAAAGTAAAFLFARRTGSSGAPVENISDAPDHVWRRGTERYEENLLGNTVTVGRTPQELYDEWRDFSRFPRFMENVESVEKLDDKRSRWTIKAPLGSAVELVTKITDDQPGKSIAWASEPDSEIETEGGVEFLEAPLGRGTYVRLTMRYSPPGGMVGKGLAKLFQREPKIQSRRDLRRFKSLMETGEVATNASPSGRSSESQTEPRI